MGASFNVSMAHARKRSTRMPVEDSYIAATVQAGTASRLVGNEQDFGRSGAGMVPCLASNDLRPQA
jgi:hypothetical protein